MGAFHDLSFRSNLRGHSRQYWHAFVMSEPWVCLSLPHIGGNGVFARRSHQGGNPW